MAKEKNLANIMGELERLDRERLERKQRFIKHRNCDKCSEAYEYTNKNSHFCLPCRSILRRERLAKRHQERHCTEEGRLKLREQSRKTYQRNREKQLEQRRYHGQALKCEVITHYGGVCNCCGESILVFLTIDHLNNDGATQRRLLKLGGGSGMYRWIKRNNFPSNFQVLCHNCNMAKAIDGTCPHQLMKEVAA